MPEKENIHQSFYAGKKHTFIPFTKDETCNYHWELTRGGTTLTTGSDKTFRYQFHIPDEYTLTCIITPPNGAPKTTISRITIKPYPIVQIFVALLAGTLLLSCALMITTDETSQPPVSDQTILQNLYPVFTEDITDPAHQTIYELRILSGLGGMLPDISGALAGLFAGSTPVLTPQPTEVPRDLGTVTYNEIEYPVFYQETLSFIAGGDQSRYQIFSGEITPPLYIQVTYHPTRTDEASWFSLEVNGTPALIYGATKNGNGNGAILPRDTYVIRKSGEYTLLFEGAYMDADVTIFGAGQ